MHWRTETVVSTALVALLAGCALGDGEPWGRLGISLSASFEPGPTRLDDGGALKTSRDYAVRLDLFEVRFDAVSVRVGPPDDGANPGFDPANPPAGYGLCHAGHCHADDGRLVPYDEIEATLGGGAAVTTLFLAVTGDAVDALGGDRQVDLGPCPDNCELERGRINQVAATIRSLRISGIVTDRLQPDLRRLPQEGFGFHADILLDQTTSASVDIPVDRGHPVNIDLALRFLPGPELFDDLDWATLGAEAGSDVDLGDFPDSTEAVMRRFRETATVEVEISRY
jgi:hypothetical protein